MRLEKLEQAAPWHQLVVTDSDVDAASDELLWDLYSQIVIIRSFEKTLLSLTRDGLVNGPMHSSIGQEGAAVGSVASLEVTDRVNGTHRGHHQFLAKALQFVASRGGRPLVGQDLPAEVTELIERTFAEILGLDTGFSGGRGGSMHLQWLEAGALGTNAIVGGGVPLAAGSAWDQQLSSASEATSDVTVTYFGDGAANIGSMLETMNLAAAWDLPLAFFVENNLYAVSTHIEEAAAETRLSARGPGFGIPSLRINGMDPLASYLAMREARSHLSLGNGPYLVEAEVYRYYHQSGVFTGSALGYRSKSEEKHWLDRDSLVLSRSRVVHRHLATEAECLEFERSVLAECEAIASRFLATDADGKKRIDEARWPSPATVDHNIRSSGIELAGYEHREFGADDTARPTPDGVFNGAFVEAVAKCLHRILYTDARALIIGEDIHRLNGGTNGATRGLVDEFPSRVLGTPISENAFAGAAGGLAMVGNHRPIVEFMFADFVLVAADQIFNQIGKLRHMYGGNVAAPIVVRVKLGIGSGYGSQHSMDPAGLFAMFPGWRIVAPSDPYEYVGLMNAAVALDDPVLVLEQTELYKSKHHYDRWSWDHHLLPGRARLAQEGADVTVITYLNMVPESLRAVEEVGISADVIDLRWLDRGSVDWATIVASVEKTGNVVIVEQGAGPAGYGAWLADEIQRRCFAALKGPVERVTGGEAAPTISRKLERAAIARSEEIAARLRSMEFRFTDAIPSHESL